MECGDNEPSSKSKPQKKITKQEWSKHGPQKIEVGSGSIWTSEHKNYARQWIWVSIVSVIVKIKRVTCFEKMLILLMV